MGRPIEFSQNRRDYLKEINLTNPPVTRVGNQYVTRSVYRYPCWTIQLGERGSFTITRVAREAVAGL